MSCRHIKILRELKCCEMSDEELLKATVDRMDAKAGILIYLDKSDQAYWFTRWRKGGAGWCTMMLNAWQKFHGMKVRRVHELDNDNEFTRTY